MGFLPVPPTPVFLGDSGCEPVCLKPSAEREGGSPPALAVAVFQSLCGFFAKEECRVRGSSLWVLSLGMADTEEALCVRVLWIEIDRKSVV